MKKRSFLRLIAIVLALSLLTGCSSVGYLLESLLSRDDTVHFRDMVYTRPDMDAHASVLEASCAAAAGTDLDAIISGIYDYYAVYDSFYTNYNLADIHYSSDLTDSYWEAEYAFCTESSVTVDAGLQSLYCALAESPCLDELESDEYFGAGFFDAYGSDQEWDAEYLALLDAESDLENRYYDLSAKALDYEYGTEAYYSECGAQMEALFVELIAVRQRIAAYLGYSDYPTYAYDAYGRDYTAADAAAYTADIQNTLVPLYRSLGSSDVWQYASVPAGEQQVFRYVKTCAKNMGGSVYEAFQLLDEAGLYDISYGENKYNSSFEVYLTAYGEPYIFTNPTGGVYDQLSFTHEFGHFVNDYVCGGSSAGMDVSEVFSQGMEYLSLCYGDALDALVKLKLADCLCTYVEQAAFADFEQQAYRLTGDALTVENVRALFAETGAKYALDTFAFDARDYVTITHFFTQPMYIISYVVSNDVAFQLYQLEQETPGTGLSIYRRTLTSQESSLLTFAETVGLESPFDAGRADSVRETLENVLAA